ncbi:dienelactone hydrolase [Polaromonas eurypsychrophila]|uniref:Dienelactone hydrolase n=1 Tax=Polaromonas eurypsychrophila TaxID=1614635 RepID=A0A916WMH4_9BURK|nr:CocE/NonD family hydrolase [Polaromonas eurypsychrophila]GGB12219.1 dienelactone hydrolase [Polaromonas eurypsychrophila]
MGKGLKALFICGLLATGLPGGVAAAAAPQEVSYPSHDGTLIKAWVVLPDGPVPRGSVVALHGCGGLYASRGARRGQLNARHQAMADMLVGQGYAAVFPDSLSPRGESELCTQKIGSRQIDQTQRRADALGTLAWVAAQPWATSGRIALLGWSHGGSAVLAATDLSRADVRAQLPQPALAVAFYPGCSAALKSGYRPNARLVLMLGEKDDWTPPGPCVELGKTMGAEVNLYADSYHDFDSPVGEVRLRLDVPNGVNLGQGVHVGPNPAAREQAYARLRELLAQAFR